MGLLAGSLLTWFLVGKGEEPGRLPAGTPPVARVSSPKTTEKATAAGSQPSRPLPAVSPSGTPGVMGFPDKPEDRIVQILDLSGVTPSEKADMLLALLRTSPVEEQPDIMRHIACLYPDAEWSRYRDLLGDATIDAGVRGIALERLGRDRPGWLVVEAVTYVLQNPRDPLRPAANQLLKTRYPAGSDFDLASFRAQAQQEHEQLSSGSAAAPSW